MVGVATSSCLGSAQVPAGVATSPSSGRRSPNTARHNPPKGPHTPVQVFPEVPPLSQAPRSRSRSGSRARLRSPSSTWTAQVRRARPRARCCGRPVCGCGACSVKTWLWRLSSCGCGCGASQAVTPLAKPQTRTHTLNPLAGPSWLNPNCTPSDPYKIKKYGDVLDPPLLGPTEFLDFPWYHLGARNGDDSIIEDVPPQLTSSSSGECCRGMPLGNAVAEWRWGMVLVNGVGECC